MRSVQLSFKHRNVLIIGGGKQAWRKAQGFLKEEAEVHLCAPVFLPEIPKELRIERVYDKECLNGTFLVYACTEDADLNHQIILDANRKGILSASIHHDNDATLHPMRERKLPYLDVAITTKGASPAYGELILQDIKERYDTTYHHRLEALQVIRKHVLQVVTDSNERTDFLRQLTNEPDAWLTFLRKAIDANTATVLCMHGNDHENTFTSLQCLMNRIPTPTIPAFVKPSETVKSIPVVRDTLHLLQIPTRYASITLEEGRISNIIKDLLPYEELLPCTIPPDELIKLLPYSPTQQLILILHESKRKDLYNGLKNLTQDDWKVMSLRDELPECDATKEVILLPILLLKGKHFTHDILSEEGLYGKFTALYPKVQVIDECLMDNERYRDWLIKKITQWK